MDEQTKPKRPLRLIIVAVILVSGGLYGYNAWSYGLTHVSTDDAYVSGEMVNISPTITARLVKLLVEEGDSVKKGQLVARLTDATQLAALEQAKAALESAKRDAEEARSVLDYQSAFQSAQVDKATSAEAVQRKRNVGLVRSRKVTSESTRDSITQARETVQAAMAQLEQASKQAEAAKSAFAPLKSAVVAADRSIRAAEARIDTAKAELERTASEESRWRKLLSQEAVSKQQYDSVRAAWLTAQARLRESEADRDRNVVLKEQAAAQLLQAEANYRSYVAASAAQAKQVVIAKTNVSLAVSRGGQVAVQDADIAVGGAQLNQTGADIRSARASTRQIAVSQNAVTAAEARIKAAEAAVHSAEVAETHTFLYAPEDGVVIKKLVNPGTAVTSGQAIALMTTSRSVWVTANFKETQLKDVKPGQPVEIAIDTFSGRTYRGTVKFINEATGASTALLPPDNSTGNFTKVVQRIPIRVDLTPEQGKKFDELKQGMSAAVTINTGSGKN